MSVGGGVCTGIVSHSLVLRTRSVLWVSFVGWYGTLGMMGSMVYGGNVFDGRHLGHSLEKKVCVW